MAEYYTIGGSLMHYRTKGSRNGVSNTPGYLAIGQKAIGRLVNGRYIYDTAQNVGRQARIGAANAYATARNQADYAGYKVRKAGSQAVSGVKSSMKSIKDWGSKTLDWAGQQASTALASVRDFISNLLQKIGAGVKAAQKWAYRKAVRARDAVYNAVRPHYNYLYKPTYDGRTGKQLNGYGVAEIRPTTPLERLLGGGSETAWRHGKDRKDTRAGKGGAHASRRSRTTRD